MKAAIFILVLVYALSCGVTGDAAKSTDQANIQGIWLAQSESQNGITKNVSYQYDFSGNKLSFRDETGKEMKYSFKLDTAGNIKLLIIQSEEAHADSTPVSVGYELIGDALKIVVAPPGMRPAAISDKNNQELIICKRKGS
ncbi:MAG: hypothetical protein JST86_13610 [Bacteroidetes bacterium]|nr:hypothetical protein [Bacteroidota bacterium]